MPDLLARSCNRLKKFAATTTRDADIIALHWLPVDLDPKRPADISSTDAEHQAAIELAEEIRRRLVEEMNWPANAFVKADSGNGCHLAVKIDLPNDGQSKDLVERCLKALDFIFSNEKVKVDTTTHNPARIWRYASQLGRATAPLRDLTGWPGSWKCLRSWRQSQGRTSKSWWPSCPSRKDRPKA